jgi:hypothetical protein
MRRRIGVFAGVVAAVCVVGAPAWAASGGDSNAGDVWLDNVGQPAGPGHEMDPHLACADIVLYGAKLADSSGKFTIDGWPPSGSKSVDFQGNWQVQSGTQQIALIPISQLMAGAQASHDSPANQGFHFKLDFSQDPQKHKTFWVNCPASSSGGTPGGGTPGGGTPGTPGTSSAPSSGSPVSTIPSGGSGKPVATVKAVHKKRKKKLTKPKRHARVKRRRVKARTISRLPAFTG